MGSRLTRRKLRDMDIYLERFGLLLWMNAPAPVISIVDIRDGGPIRHARERAAQARALRDACLAIFPRAMLPALPLLDRAARRWLTRSRSPYVGEVGQVADTLGFPGVWLLNASYQWACTALAREEGGAPWLVRTLDWPFQGLGRHADVARMRGEAGEFFSVTWPGYVGALTAMAPLRFAASINQAPMRRWTAHRWLRLFDFARNGIASWTCHGHMPPDQLLRHVFERCGNYADARCMLVTTPVARPVIFTLVGCAAGERCVIERTETGSITRENNTSAANDWVPESARPGKAASARAGFWSAHLRKPRLTAVLAASRCAIGKARWPCPGSIGSALPC